MTILPLTPALAPRWDAFVTQHPAGWLWHSAGWLSYEASRLGVENASIALSDGDRLVAIVPMILERGELQAAGEPIADPLSAGVPMLELLNGVRCYLPDRGITRARYRGMPTREKPALLWRDISWQTQVLDLSPPVETLFHGLRKSYRSGATDVRKLADQHEVVTGPDWLEDFRAVHEAFWLRESGAVALNDEQWAVIARWVASGIGRLYGVPGEAWVLVYSWKGWSYYASGPSLVANRNAMLQWVAINDLKASGVRFYELGWHARPGEDEKHQQIAFFKQGFGGEVWRQPAMEWRA